MLRSSQRPFSSFFKQEETYLCLYHSSNTLVTIKFVNFLVGLTWGINHLEIYKVSKDSISFTSGPTLLLHRSGQSNAIISLSISPTMPKLYTVTLIALSTSCNASWNNSISSALPSWEPYTPTAVIKLPFCISNGTFTTVMSYNLG